MGGQSDFEEKLSGKMKGKRLQVNSKLVGRVGVGVGGYRGRAGWMQIRAAVEWAQITDLIDIVFTPRLYSPLQVIPHIKNAHQ